jgi:hypothetical protein
MANAMLSPEQEAAMAASAPPMLSLKEAVPNPLVLPSDTSLATLLTKLDSYDPAVPVCVSGPALKAQGCNFSDPKVPLLVSAAVDRVIHEVISKAILCKDLWAEAEAADRKQAREAEKAKREMERRIRLNNRNRGNKKRKKGDKAEEEEEEEEEEEDDDEDDDEAANVPLIMQDFVMPLKVWGVDVGCKVDGDDPNRVLHTN